MKEEVTLSRVKITETSLRDGHQSLMATRLTTAEILPIVEKMDRAGYYSLEVWGGATFDSAIRFLNEDPWERLREIRKRVKNTKLQMLLRGQNLLGYRHYADDIVDKFVEKSIKNGIDIIRTFDALNDVRNIRQASESTKKYGGHSQLAICYTISPVHTIEYYKNLALEMQNMGADSIAIKDMAGILLPYRAYELVTELKKVISVPIEVHTHNTAGLGAMTNLKSVEAGIDIVDTAISPLSGGTSQPTTESLVRTLQGTEYDTGIDLNLLKEIAEYFKPIRKKYLDKGTLNPQALCTEPNIVEYQLPGGMLSNMLSQLKAQKAENRYEDVLKEIPKVREDLGYPPLVTPMSQMIPSRLNKENYRHYIELDYEKIFNKISEVTEDKKLNPYYMYRQKNSFQWGENLGYSLEGEESVYNIEMIEENKTVIGIGAGAITKLIHYNGTEKRNSIKRLVNPKDPLVWINELPVRLEEKKQALRKLLEKTDEKSG